MIWPLPVSLLHLVMLASCSLSDSLSPSLSLSLSLCLSVSPHPHTHTEPETCPSGQLLNRKLRDSPKPYFPILPCCAKERIPVGILRAGYFLGMDFLTRLKGSALYLLSFSIPATWHGIPHTPPANLLAEKGRVSEWHFPALV